VVIMSAAETWDLVVPEDDAELLAELHRHGVRPGQRLWVVEPAGDSAEWHRTMSALITAAAVIASAKGEVADALRAAIGPQLGAITRARAEVVHGRRELSADDREALVAVARALQDALLDTGRLTEATAEPEEGRSRRKLRFTGVSAGPPDLAARTDEYLAEGFGRE
jgi:hypothetical protein